MNPPNTIEAALRWALPPFEKDSEVIVQYFVLTEKIFMAESNLVTVN